MSVWIYHNLAEYFVIQPFLFVVLIKQHLKSPVFDPSDLSYVTQS